ncbi:MAG: CMP/dCMP kinase [Candidatus Atribacteria bacterium]|jgi:cytidylate kinase|uniref:(d)CMP kinase n=1 Tax=Atrimonas thermophila TaxID=3064161 RepID=UPI0024ABAE81|nr:CMP/dCMP kinase [Candidatus Atribacteria bacterium]
MKKTIAIDGPAGAGKSTVASELAARLGYLYVDTGAMYRAVTLFLILKGVDIQNRKLVQELLDEVEIELTEEGRVFLNGKEVTREIRTPLVDQMVSPVAALKEVRRFLRTKQRNLALSRPSVTEGRDIGTVILPDADLKIFLTASPEIRARRRWLQLKERGQKIDYKLVLRNILERDYIDSNRSEAPLKMPEGALLIDSSFLSKEQVVDLIYNLVRQ